jgi:hypothetical protein
MLQGIHIKLKKNPRIIWDGSTKASPDQIVFNEHTSMEFEAIIDFGKAKIKLLILIYNWRISLPTKVIYIALTDIIACFQFPRIAADIYGAFGFVADGTYFMVKNHVFGSNISCSSCRSQVSELLVQVLKVSKQNPVRVSYYNTPHTITHSVLLNTLMHQRI